MSTDAGALGQGDQQVEIKEWLENPPFTQPSPATLMSAVCTTLESNNRESAVSPDAALSGSTALSDANGNGVLTQAPDATDDHHRDHPLWEVRPPSTWFKCPLGRRELVGQSLVQAAQAKAVTAALGVHDQGEAQAMDQPCPSLWDSPFLVGSLNVGFRGLSCSLRGLVGLVEVHRPDVLFLADLRTPRRAPVTKSVACAKTWSGN